MFVTKKRFEELEGRIDKAEQVVRELYELANTLGYVRKSRAVKVGGWFGDPDTAKLEYYWEKKGDKATQVQRLTEELFKGLTGEELSGVSIVKPKRKYPKKKNKAGRPRKSK
jgi:hypothetical protein